MDVSAQKIMRTISGAGSLLVPITQNNCSHPLGNECLSRFECAHGLASRPRAEELLCGSHKSNVCVEQ